MYVTAALPPVPVMAAGVPGTVLVTDIALVTVVPSQPLTTTVMVPVVKVDEYFIFIELPLPFKLMPIVVGLETDHAYDTASTAVIEYKALSPAPILPQAFALPVMAAVTEKLQVDALTDIDVVAVLLQPVAGSV
jgi:hypothetical protein